MKKTSILILSACGILLFANCHEKAFPKDSDKTKTVTKVTTTITTSIGTANPSTPEEQRVQGKVIFESQCNKCHDLPKPGEYTVKSWDNILPSMFRKANLSEDKGVMVKAYVMSNAKEG